jgi:dolichol-phosphate mannosyltransferase
MTMSTQTGVVIPTYLEGKNIASLILSILEFCPEAQVVIVDDSPTNETADAVRSLNKSNVTAIHRKQKGGRGSAVIEGIAYLLKQDCTWIVEMDADFSHPPSQIPALLKEVREKNLDLLIASRYLPESIIENWPLTRRLFSKASNLLARQTLRVPICDYTNGYRVYSKNAASLIVETCGKLGKGFIALSEILVNLYFRDLKVAEVPTIFTNRVRGESSVNASEVTNALVGLLKILKLKWQLIEEKRVRCLTGNQ